MVCLGMNEAFLFIGKDKGLGVMKNINIACKKHLALQVVRFTAKPIDLALIAFFFLSTEPLFKISLYIFQHLQQ